MLQQTFQRQRQQSPVVAADNQRFVLSKVQREARAIRAGILARYDRTDRAQGHVAANRELLAFSTRDTARGIPNSLDDDTMRAWAKARAREVARIISSAPTEQLARQQINKLCDSLKIPRPRSRRREDHRFALARALDPDWWKRTATRARIAINEAEQRELGLVHRLASPYVSEDWLQTFKRRRRASEIAAQDCLLINENGESLCLADVAEKSTSNPTKRRIELMVRCRGLEELAAELGHCAAFVTMSLPSKYHSHHYRDGSPNRKHNGTTPREGWDQLQILWSRIRAALKRRGIVATGLRVGEPHHDGTPHWHFLFFGPRKELEAICEEVRRYSLFEDGDERGASERRVQIEWIDSDKGTATGYIAKYIAKGTDATCLGDALLKDENGELQRSGSPDENAVRIQAWISALGVRQFQFFGTCSVGEYREARRIREPVDDAGIEAVRAAADQGDWAAFTTAQTQHQVRIVRKDEQRENKYGEPMQPPIQGLARDSAQVTTREHTWSPIWLSGRVSAPWTSENNCTDLAGPAARRE